MQLDSLINLLLTQEDNLALISWLENSMFNVQPFHNIKGSQVFKRITETGAKTDIYPIAPGVKSDCFKILDNLKNCSFAPIPNAIWVTDIRRITLKLREAQSLSIWLVLSYGINFTLRGRPNDERQIAILRQITVDLDNHLVYDYQR